MHIEESKTNEKEVTEGVGGKRVESVMRELGVLLL
jgi:hypothetical protein